MLISRHHISSFPSVTSSFDCCSYGRHRICQYQRLYIRGEWITDVENDPIIWARSIFHRRVVGRRRYVFGSNPVHPVLVSDVAEQNMNRLSRQQTAYGFVIKAMRRGQKLIDAVTAPVHCPPTLLPIFPIEDHEYTLASTTSRRDLVSV